MSSSNRFNLPRGVVVRRHHRMTKTHQIRKPRVQRAVRYKENIVRNVSKTKPSMINKVTKRFVMRHTKFIYCVTKFSDIQNACGGEMILLANALEFLTLKWIYHSPNKYTILNMETFEPISDENVAALTFEHDPGEDMTCYMLMPTEDDQAYMNAKNAIAKVCSRYLNNAAYMADVIKKDPNCVTQVVGKELKIAKSWYAHKQFIFERCPNCKAFNHTPLDQLLESRYCGLCYHSLDTGTGPPEPYNAIAMYEGPVRGKTILEQLSECGLGDITDPELTRSSVQRIIRHDLAIAKQHINRSRMRLVTIPGPLLPSESREIKSIFEGWVIVEQPQLDNHHPALHAVRKLYTMSLYKLATEKQTVIDIGSVGLFMTNQIPLLKHCINPKLTLGDMQRPLCKWEHCEHRLAECRCNVGKNALALSVDSLYDIRPQELADWLSNNNQKGIFAVVSMCDLDLNKNPCYLHGMQVTQQGSDLICSLAGDSEPYVHNCANVLLWLKNDAIMVSQGMLAKTIISTCCGVQLWTLQLVNKVGLHATVQRPTFTYPYLSLNVVDGKVESIIDTTRTMKLNQELLNRLETRFTDHNLTTEDIRTYVLGLTRVSFSGEGGVRKVVHVDTEEMEAHVIRALLNVRAKCALARMVIGNEPMNGLTLRQVIVSGIGTFLRALPRLQLMSGTMLAMLPSVVEKVILPSQQDCGHHVCCTHQFTEYLCACCKKMVTGAVNTLCECCKPTCNHRCHHRCVGEASHGEGIKCDCCGINSSTNPCKWCCGEGTFMFEPGAVGEARKMYLTAAKQGQQSSKPGTQKPKRVESTPSSKPQPEQLTIREPKQQRLKVEKARYKETPQASGNAEAQLFAKAGVKFTRMLITDNGILSNGSELLIEFLKRGTTIMTVDTVEILQRISIPNVGMNTCLIETLEYSYHLPRAEITSYVGDVSAGAELSVLRAFIDAKGLNAVIVSPISVSIQHNNDSDQYQCIELTRAAKGLMGHFQPIEMRFRVSPRPMVPMGNILLVDDGNWFNLTNQEYIKKLNNLLIPAEELSDNKVVSFYWKIVTKDGKKYLTNNDSMRTNWHEGEATIELSDTEEPYAQAIIKIDPIMSQKIEISGNWGTLNELLDKVSVFRKYTLILIARLRNYMTCGRGLLPELHWKNMTLYQNKAGQTIMLNANPRLKTGDMVVVEYKTIYVTCTVVQTAGNYYLTNIALDDLSVYVRVAFTKMSIGSMLRRCTYTMPTLKQVSELENLIRTGTVVMGVPGSGKTTDLIQNAPAGAIAVCLTRESVNNIKRRSDIQSMTIESFLSSPGNNRRHMIVDECSMLLPEDLLYLAAKEPLSCSFYGDYSQISAIDSWAIEGIRVSSTISDFLPATKTNQKTYRIGAPLSTILHNTLLPGLTSGAKHETQFNYVQLEGLFNMVKYIKDLRYDMVLCFYNQHVSIMKQEGITRCETVHRYEGCESDVIVILDVGFSKGNVHNQHSYLVVAATRAVRRLEWLTDSGYSTLEERLNSSQKGGAENNNKLTYPLTERQYETLINKYPETSGTYTKFGVEVQYQLLSDRLEIVAPRSLHKFIIPRIDKEVGLEGVLIRDITTYNQRRLIRMLGWVGYQMQSMGLTLKLAGATFEYDKGCSIFCQCTIRQDNHWIKIYPSYTDWFGLRVRSNLMPLEAQAMFTVIMDDIESQLNTSLMDDIRLIQERWEAIKYKFDITIDSLHPYQAYNDYLYNHLFRNSGILSRKADPKIKRDLYKQVIFRGTSAFRYFYRTITGEDLLEGQVLDYLLKNWLGYHDMRKHVEGKWPGLLMELDWHKMNKTSVWSQVDRVQSELTGTMIEQKKSPLWVPDETHLILFPFQKEQMEVYVDRVENAAWVTVERLYRRYTLDRRFKDAGALTITNDAMALTSMGQHVGRVYQPDWLCPGDAMTLYWDQKQMQYLSILKSSLMKGDNEIMVAKIDEQLSGGETFNLTSGLTSALKNSTVLDMGLSMGYLSIESIINLTKLTLSKQCTGLIFTEALRVDMSMAPPSEEFLEIILHQRTFISDAHTFTNRVTMITTGLYKILFYELTDVSKLQWVNYNLETQHVGKELRIPAVVRRLYPDWEDDTIIISENMYDRLMTRMLAPDCNFATMLSYARSMLNTIEYGRRNYWFKYTYSTSYLIMAIICIMLHNNGRVLMTTRLLGLLPKTENSTINDLVTLGKTQLLAKFSTLIKELANALNDELNAHNIPGLQLLNTALTNKDAIVESLYVEEVIRRHELLVHDSTEADTYIQCAVVSLGTYGDLEPAIYHALNKYDKSAIVVVCESDVNLPLEIKTIRTKTSAMEFNLKLLTLNRQDKTEAVKNVVLGFMEVLANLRINHVIGNVTSSFLLNKIRCKTIERVSTIPWFLSNDRMNGKLVYMYPSPVDDAFNLDLVTGLIDYPDVTDATRSFITYYISKRLATISGNSTEMQQKDYCCSLMNKFDQEEEEKTVYITFGVMPTPDILEEYLDQIDNLGYRVIIHPNVKVARRYTKRLLNIYSCRMWLKLVIHHGGAGTTQTCFDNGIAQYIIPGMYSDMINWIIALRQVGLTGGLMPTEKGHSLKGVILNHENRQLPIPSLVAETSKVVFISYGSRGDNSLFELLANEAEQQGWKVELHKNENELEVLESIVNKRLHVIGLINEYCKEVKARMSMDADLYIVCPHVLQIISLLDSTGKLWRMLSPNGYGFRSTLPWVEQFLSGMALGGDQRLVRKNRIIACIPMLGHTTDLSIGFPIPRLYWNQARSVLYVHKVPGFTKKIETMVELLGAEFGLELYIDEYKVDMEVLSRAVVCVHHGGNGFCHLCLAQGIRQLIYSDIEDRGFNKRQITSMIGECDLCQDVQENITLINNQTTITDRSGLVSASTCWHNLVDACSFGAHLEIERPCGPRDQSIISYNELVNVQYDTIYDPETDIDCVAMCIREHVKSEESTNFPKNVRFDVDVGNLESLIVSLGLSLRLIRENSGVEYILNNDRPVLEMVVVNVGNQVHAKLVKITKMEHIRMNITVDKRRTTLADSKRAIEYLRQHEVLPLAQVRLTQYNWQENLSRKSAIGMVNVYDQQKEIVCQNMSTTLCYLLGVETICMALIECRDGNSAKIYIISGVLTLGSNILISIKNLERRSGSTFLVGERVAVNQQTARYYQNKCNEVLRVHNDITPSLVYCASHFDTRTHDKFDMVSLYKSGVEMECTEDARSVLLYNVNNNHVFFEISGDTVCMVVPVKSNNIACYVLGNCQSEITMDKIKIGGEVNTLLKLAKQLEEYLMVIKPRQRVMFKVPSNFHGLTIVEGQGTIDSPLYLVGRRLVELGGKNWDEVEELQFKPESRAWRQSGATGTSKVRRDLTQLDGMVDQLEGYAPVKKVEDVPRDKETQGHDVVAGQGAATVYHESMPDANVIDYWRETDLIDLSVKHWRLDGLTLQSRSFIGSLREEVKISMTQYPEHSREVLTKLWGTEHNAVAARLGGRVDYRKVEVSAPEMIDALCRTYFRDGWRGMLINMQSNQVGIDMEATKNWLEARPDGEKISESLKSMIYEGLEFNAMNEVQVFNKLESLLKDAPIGTHADMKVRIIVWQKKAICSLFSPIFIQAKERLKSLLSDNVLYTDGYRPDQLSNYLHDFRNVMYFLENDMTQQDRQTDQMMIDCEFELYRRLGVHPGVLRIWRTIHRNWRARGKTVTGLFDGMRLTGQATTALGNAIVNMICHQELFEDNKTNIEFYMFLGDDSIFGMRRTIDVTMLSTRIKYKHNMLSKATQHQGQGTFCSLMVLKTVDGSIGVGPDIVRLWRRYQLTNGASKSTIETLTARQQSYLFMLGRNLGTLSVEKARGWDLGLIEYYDIGMVITRCASKYKISDSEVINYWSQLLAWLKEPPQVYEQRFKILTEVERIK